MCDLVCVNLYSQLAKILKQHLHGIENCQSSAIRHVFSPWHWHSFSRLNFSHFILFVNISDGETSRDRANIYCHQIGSHVLSIEWHICECFTLWPWPTFSMTQNLKCAQTLKRPQAHICIHLGNLGDLGNPCKRPCFQLTCAYGAI